MKGRYAAAMAQARERVRMVCSTRVETRWGIVEYLDEGDGMPVLWSHGVLGGHDNVRELVDLYVGGNCRAIGPSRFGYLGSTMPPQATPAAQADAFAALLDELHVHRVLVIGFSAGGPAAIQFALRHRGRLHGLVLASAYLPGMGHSVPAALHPIMRTMAGWERGWWLLKRFRPNLLARIMGVPPGWDASHDPDFLAIRDALFPVSPKKLGIAFDALVSEPASNTFPLEAIRVPTLIVHASDDPLAPYRHVPVAAARIPDARLVALERGGHLFLEHQGEVRDAIAAFTDDAMRDACSA
jgi:pimeloyl-ACP methyl ester carboxylesterase